MRGARSFIQGRFESVARETFDDGWTAEEQSETALRTEVTVERARSIMSHNDSPDVGFDRSINPYRGCEHGCIYCYARPSHAYLELSPGLDFETKLFAKTNAAELLRERSRKPATRRAHRARANTDCYQPIERKYKITRQVLEVLAECEHPVTMVTKSALVERDLDILGPMAEKNLVRVYVSIGTLDRELARKLEPRAASPQRRLDILKNLSKNGVPCGVMVAALIPPEHKTMEHGSRRGAGGAWRPGTNCGCQRAQVLFRSGSPSITRSAPSMSSASSTRCAAEKTTIRASVRA